MPTDDGCRRGNDRTVCGGRSVAEEQASGKETPIFKPRHSDVNLRQWQEASRRYETAMEDGRIDPHEHNDILGALADGTIVGTVVKAAEAIAAAMSRSTDPEYIRDLTAVYVANVERMPILIPPAA